MKKIISYTFAISAGISGFMCHATLAQAAETTVTCAKEGQNCVVPNAQTPIIYGKNGATVTTIGVTSIDCSNKAFGKDPLKGETKSCTYSIDPNKLNWTQCAKEGQQCSFTGAKLVRYGANNWVYSSYINGVKCDNGHFGDPDKGKSKHCEVSTN